MAQSARGAHRADQRDVDTINSAWIELHATWPQGAATRDKVSPFLRACAGDPLRFDGSAYRTMLRNDAYWFSRLGLYLERADNTARILDVYHVLLPEKEHVGGPLGLLSVGFPDPALGLGADRPSLGLSRDPLKPWLIADLLDPQRLAAAVAGELLWQSLARKLRSDRAALWPPGPRPALTLRGIRCVNRIERALKMDDLFQRAACTNYPGIPLRTTPAWRYRRQAVSDVTPRLLVDRHAPGRSPTPPPIATSRRPPA